VEQGKWSMGGKKTTKDELDGLRLVKKGCGRLILNCTEKRMQEKTFKKENYQ